MAERGTQPNSLARRSRRSMRRAMRRMPIPHRFWAALKRLLQLDDDPHSVARGIAIGLVIAFTPTVGIQMFLVVVIHTLCRANRLAGIAMVWISNPVTLVPIYWADYQVGRWVLRSPSIAYDRFTRLFELHAHGFVARFLEFLDHLRPVFGDVAIPMFLGGFLVGVALAIPAYPLTLRLVDLERRGKARLAALRQKRHERQARRTRGG